MNSTAVLPLTVFQEKAVSLVNTCKERAAWYLTPNLLIPFGGDYAFTDAAAKFKEMDQIMAYVNSHSDVSFAIAQLDLLGMHG